VPTTEKKAAPAFGTHIQEAIQVYKGAAYWASNDNTLTGTLTTGATWQSFPATAQVTCYNASNLPALATQG